MIFHLSVTGAALPINVLTGLLLLLGTVNAVENGTVGDSVLVC